MSVRETTCFGLMAGLLCASFLACGSEPPSARGPAEERARPLSEAPSATAGPSPAETGASVSSTATAASTSSSATRASAELPAAIGIEAKRIFEKPVVFAVTGEDGRLAVLAHEDQSLVPYRREAGKWEKLTLPAAYAGRPTEITAGMWFGRDNRPRLMGYRKEASPTRMIYLRFKDGAWKPELREIGSLGKDTSGVLFGVLGEADPEVVCRIDDRCLIKSRKGWKETPPTLPPSAVVRAFFEQGYAATEDGLFRAEDKAFVRVGSKAIWRSAPSGFAVTSSRAVSLVAHGDAAIYELLTFNGEWVRVEVPLAHPRDVAGEKGSRYLVGDEGALHEEGARWSRIEGTTGALHTVLVAGHAVYFAGSGGLFEVAKKGR